VRESADAKDQLLLDPSKRKTGTHQTPEVVLFASAISAVRQGNKPTEGMFEIPYDGERTDGAYEADE